MKNIVQFCSFRSVYNTNLQKELKKHFAVIGDTCTAIYFDELIKLFESKSKCVYSKMNLVSKCVYWKRLNKYLDEEYSYRKNGDVVNIQYADFRYLFIAKYLKRNFRRIIISFWGSDLLRQSERKLRLMRPLFALADIITLETNEMRTIFEKKIGKKYSKKIRIVKFGLSELDLIDSTSCNEVKNFCIKNKINYEKKVVMVGYNRIIQQQHIAAIQSMVDNKIKFDDIFLIIPWTYGNEDLEYKKRIMDTIGEHYEYCFLDYHMTDKEIACLRKATDIFVQIQITDSLSATMLETLYAKKKVITGSWLPYDDLLEMGIVMNLVDKPNDVGCIVKRMIDSPNDSLELHNNYKLIKKMSTWESNILKWIECYYD